MTRKLHISNDLSLPLDAVTRRMAILAMSGAGKSNLAVVLAEAMFDAGIPWVAIDPKGDWWGVRSNESGKGPGLPIPIFGGLHGDVPLEPTAGHLIADLIINQRLTCVLDVSEFPDRQGMWLFLHDLGERLLRQNREALHLFLEEADEYIPQRPGEKGNLLKCKGVWQRVVKRGRFRGLGSTQISQRSASLDKDTLYQAEVLFALRAGGKGDKDAIEGWVEYHNAASEIIESLPTLDDGEGWVSSPAYLKITKRVQFSRRRTFDSGATPVLLKGTMRPATLADIDLVAINTKMAATIEKAKATDPKELQKKVNEGLKQIRDLTAELEREKSKKPAATRTETKFIEKRIMAVQAINRLEGLLEKASAIPGVVEEIRAAIREGKELNTANMIAAPSNDLKVFEPGFGSRSRTAPRSVATPRAPQSTAAKLSENSNGDKPLPKGEREVLAALIQYPDGLERSQIGVLTGHVKRSTRDAYIYRLSTKGYVIAESGQKVQATEEGIAALPDAQPLPTGTALQEYWLAKLPGGEDEILKYLIAAYPATVDREKIGEATGYDKRSTRDAYIYRLSQKQLVTSTSSGVQASANLF